KLLTAGCSALTDERGLFRLPCAPPNGAALTFERAGWFTQEIAPVGVESPLTVTLRRSGFASGRVVDAAGAGVPARLLVSYALGQQCEAACAADGTFNISLAFPGRYLIRPFPDGRSNPELRTAFYDGPQADIELRLPAVAEATVTVHAVD